MQSFPKGNKFYFGTSAGVAIKDSISQAKKSIKIISPYISSEKIDLLVNKANENVKVTVITQYDDEKNKLLHSVIKSTVEQKRTYTEETVNTYIDKTVIEKKPLPENIEFRKSLLNQRWLQLSWLIVGVFISIAIINFPLPISAENLSFFSFIRYLVAAIAMGYFIVFISHSIDKKTRVAFNIPIFEDVELCTSEPSSTKTVTCDYEYVIKPNLTIKFAPKGTGDTFGSILHCKLYIIDDSVAYIGSMNFTNSGFSKNYELRAKFVEKEDVINLISAFETISSQVECVDISSEYPLVLKELTNTTFNEYNVQKNLKK